MTRPDNTELMRDVLQLLTEEGSAGFAEGLRILLNEAMLQERSAALGALPYERTGSRAGHANGFKDKTLDTRMGRITFSIPQVRGGLNFYPSSLEKGVRSEEALKVAMAEMYVQGVSTRKVGAIIEKLCGHSVSSARVSACAAHLDDHLRAWRERPLGAFPYVIVDARYESVRVGSTLVDCAVLVAVGIAPDGKRSVLGVSVALSEAEAHWREFLAGLQRRGLHGVELIVSDAHEGLRAARRAVFPSVPWQRCQFHLQQNAQAHVPRVEMRAGVAQDIRGIFNSPDLAAAERRLAEIVGRYAKTAPGLAEWMEKNLPEGFAVFAFPAAHQRRLRTSNCVERVNQEIKRRTRVASIFPNENSLLRLVSAILAEIDDEWQSSRIYLNMDLKNPPTT